MYKRQAQAIRNMWPTVQVAHSAAQQTEHEGLTGGVAILILFFANTHRSSYEARSKSLLLTDGEKAAGLYNAELEFTKSIQATLR